MQALSQSRHDKKVRLYELFAEIGKALSSASRLELLDRQAPEVGGALVAGLVLVVDVDVDAVGAALEEAGPLVLDLGDPELVDGALGAGNGVVIEAGDIV